MANSEHLKILMEGVKSWNRWIRFIFSDSQPDLTHANLAWAELDRINLQGTNLTGADMIGAHLYRSNLLMADLSAAKLGGADLRHSDLSGASLCEADLSHADLSQANLSRSILNQANLIDTKFGQADLTEARLDGANLSGADLRTAKLSKAHLNGANLVGANLEGADLSDSQLVGANLSNARLNSVNFSRADLTTADFHEVRTRNTIFVGNDLSTVKGLDTVRHEGPSTIDVDTLFNSDHKIPEVFLRGLGLQEGFITYLPSFVARPIEFYSCFISYSHADKSFARRLHDTLQGRGIRCWLDEHELLPGDKIYTEIDYGIRVWDKLLLCCSEKSLASWWVDNEIKIAFAKEQQLRRERGKEVLVLIPLNLDNYLFEGNWQSGLATEVKARLAANFTGWEHDNNRFDEQFERLVKALRTDSRGKLPPPPKRL
jgi:uncharacterized protein YjbI with pentapeptide repeats